MRPQTTLIAPRKRFVKLLARCVESSNVSAIERPGQGWLRRKSDASRLCRVIAETYLTDLEVLALKAMHKALHAPNFLWKWLSVLIRRSV